MMAQAAATGTVGRERPPAELDRVERGYIVLLIGLITLGGLLVRLPSFTDALFGDELSTYFIASGHSLGQVLDIVRSDQEVTPPLYFVLAWAFAKLGGDPSESLRLISLIAGTAAIPLTYLLGLWTVGRLAGLVGSAIVALSPFLIFFSTEARAYELMLLLALLSTLALLRALGTGAARWWVAYAAFSCAAMYTQYTVAFVLAVQLGWALWTQPQARRALLVANLAAAAAYLPWLSGYINDSQGPNSIPFLQPFGLRAIRIDLTHWWIGHPYNPPLSSVPGRVAVAMAIAGIGAGLVGLALRARAAPSRPWARVPARTVLVALLALATPVGIAIYSSIGDSVWQSKNLIASTPGFAVAIGGIVTGARGPLRVAAIGLLLAAYAIGAVKMLDTGYQRPDYKGVAAFIDQTGAPGDPIVEEPASANPITSLDESLAEDGSSKRHPVLRVGLPKLSEQLRAREPGGAGPTAVLPVPHPKAVAMRAARLGRGRDLFVVGYSSGFPSAAAASRVPEVPLGEFLHALPSRFRPVETRAFPGLSFFPGQVPAVTVYVLRDEGGGR